MVVSLYHSLRHSKFYIDSIYLLQAFKKETARTPLKSQTPVTDDHGCGQRVTPAPVIYISSTIRMIEFASSISALRRPRVAVNYSFGSYRRCATVRHWNARMDEDWRRLRRRVVAMPTGPFSRVSFRFVNRHSPRSTVFHRFAWIKDQIAIACPERSIIESLRRRFRGVTRGARVKATSGRPLAFSSERAIG